MMAKFLSLQRNAFILFLLLGLLTFFNALNHPVMLDDHTFSDAASRDPRNLWLNLVPDKAKVLHLEGPQTDDHYRPLALIVPRLINIISNGNVVIIHVFYLLMFIAACLALRSLLLHLSKNVVFSTLVPVFVLVHPLNGIIVNYKSAGIFALQLLLLLFCAHVLCFRKTSFRERFFVFLCYLGALFCHENAFIFPPALALLSLFVQQKEAAQIWREQRILWITAFAYFLLRLKWASLYGNIFAKFDGYHMSLWEYAASCFSMQVWYVSRFFVPDGIVAVTLKPVVRDLTAVWVLGGCAVWGVMFWVLWRFFRHRVWILAGFSWFFLGMILMAIGGLFNGQALLFAPQWLMWTSIGFFMILADVIVMPARRVFANVSLVMVVVLISGWVVISWRYNELWHDEMKYASYWQEQSPLLKTVHKYLARGYFVKGQFDDASQQYGLALTGQYGDHVIYTNLGSIALFQGHLTLARLYLSKAVRIEPRSKNALNTLAAVCLKLNDWSAAEEYFKRSVSADPFDTTAQYNLQYFLKLKANRSHEASKPLIILRAN